MFPDWPPRARTADGTALHHYTQLYRHFMSQYSEFCRYNPLSCFSTSVYCCCLFRYRLSLETFGYTFVYPGMFLTPEEKQGKPQSGLFWEGVIDDGGQCKGG
jgi:hypothetical protein